ncbi:MAG: hypothetical protein IKB16_06715 [Lentisphaeria bacterium]|nr:hypothetical protein [Lentisphaeria bacterium]
MMRKILFAAFSLCFCFYFIACSFYTREEQYSMLRLGLYSPETYRSDLSVQQLIAAMQRANDPAKKFMNAERYLLKQKTVAETEVDNRRTAQEYVTEIKFCKPDSIRWTHYRNGKPFKINICRNGAVWEIDPLSKRAEKLPEGFGLDLFRTMIALLNPSKTYLDVFKDVSVDRVLEDRVPCYRLVCQAYNEEIPPYVIYVNEKTFRTMKVETIQFKDDGSQSLYISIPQEYTWFGDVLMPRVTTVTYSGQRNISMVLEFILNPNIPDEDFQIPERFQIKL